MKALAFEAFFPMPVDTHQGSLHVPGTINQLREVLSIHSGAIIKKRPQIVKAGEVARIRIKTEDKVPLEKGERVVIGYNGDTVKGRYLCADRTTGAWFALGGLVTRDSPFAQSVKVSLRESCFTWSARTFNIRQMPSC